MCCGGIRSQGLWEVGRSLGERPHGMVDLSQAQIGVMIVPWPHALAGAVVLPHPELEQHEGHKTKELYTRAMLHTRFQGTGMGQDACP